MLCFELAWKFVLARKRPMLLSLAGIVFGVAFLFLPQAQTSGFEKFFIQTILGTNGALKISDRFQDPYGVVEKIDQHGEVRFLFHSREGALYVEGVHQPDKIRSAYLMTITVWLVFQKLWRVGVFSKLSHGNNLLKFTEFGGRIILASDLRKQMIQGSSDDFSADQRAFLLVQGLLQRLKLNPGDRVHLAAGSEKFIFPCIGYF